MTTTMTKALVQAQIRVRSALTERSERGDVPGWVLITIMTAGLVTAIWAIANDQLKDLFQKALDGVKGPGK